MALGAKLVFLPPDHKVKGGKYSLVFIAGNLRLGCGNTPSAPDSITPGSRGGKKVHLAPGVTGVSNRGGNKDSLAPEGTCVGDCGGNKGSLAPEHTGVGGCGGNKADIAPEDRMANRVGW